MFDCQELKTDPPQSRIPKFDVEPDESYSIPRSKPASTWGTSPKHTPGSYPVSSTQSRINDLLRKSLSGELIDTQFYAFSARSKLEATKPRALFSNDEALVTNSKYFSGLLSKKSRNDPTLVKLQDYHACEESVSINDYGYASDSDLDEEEEEEEETSATVQDNEVGVSVPEDRVPGLAQITLIKKFVANEAQRIIPSRRILVTDTAFKTWQALLYYLYTDQIVFAPLRSQPDLLVMPGISCSPKSMYRLACKIKHVTLQDKALAAIRSSLTERNIVQEISSSLTLRFPAVLEMEVETLFQHVATPTVMKDFPTLIKRIAGAGLPHGADILIQLHERMLKQHYPRIFSPKPAPQSVPIITSKVPVKGRGIFADDL